MNNCYQQSFQLKFTEQLDVQVNSLKIVRIMCS